MRKIPKLDQRTKTAFHEAGHALAHYVFQNPYDEVSIVPGPDGFGQITYEPREIFVNDLPDREVDELIITSLAGMAAEARKSGRTSWMHGSQDFNFAFDLAAKLTHLAESDLELYLKYLWDRAQMLLRRRGHWLGVERVATRLLKDNHLDSDEVAAIFQSSLQPDPECRPWRLTASPAAAQSFFAYLIRKKLRRKR